MHSGSAASHRIIELQKGMPDDALLPRQLLQRCVQLPFQNAPSTFALLNYGEDGGTDAFRRNVAAFVNAASPEITEGQFRSFEASEFFSTAGNSHALSMLCTLLVSARATVLCDDPSYPFALKIFRDHEASLIAVPMTSSGQTDVQAMQRAAHEARNAGRPVAFAYVVPSFHNPTGRSMNIETRRALVQLAHEQDFFVVADDVYQLLPFEGHRAPPALICFEQDTPPEQCRVISLGSLSKICAPALRSGWLQTRCTRILEQFLESGELQSGGGFSAFVNQTVENMLAEPEFFEHLKFIRKRLGDKADVLCKALDDELVSKGLASYDKPEGGYFVWVRLTDDVQKHGSNAEHVLKRCLEEKPIGLKYFHGSFFSCNGNHQHHLRLSFALYPEEELKTAAKILAKVIQEIISK